MFWKILGVVALVWIALALVGVLVKGLFWILAVSAVVFGVYLLVKAFSDSDSQKVTKI
ncbi:hypothetical protein ACFWPA_10195 [Rhodococcus sp. NPDC058505]|uniref:hypothetical protein n=1 Tax=unclassified Rhodococcus (in: high G+C Gram-positive bacteria) TaxID=192944 RepID=UPI00364F9BE5